MTATVSVGIYNMKVKSALFIAVLTSATLTLRAQDAQIVSDNLAYSREFYSGVHFVAIATLPSSFAYDRYPDNGAERIRCDDGTFARQHSGQPWLKSADWGRTGSAVDKDTAQKWEGGLSLENGPL